MYMTKTEYVGQIEEILHISDKEALNTFFDKWAAEGYTATATGVDEVTLEAIELYADEFFTDEDLTAMEKFLDEPDRTRADIVRFYFKGDAS